jgi:hypothetical protein
MSFISLAFGLPGAFQTQVGYLLLDALLSEETDLTGQVSRYPVETGNGQVTDNITNESEVLSIAGSIAGGSAMFLSAGGRSKLIAAKDAIRRIREERIPVTIITGMDVYENMGLESAKITRNSAIEKIDVAFEFRKMILVTLRSADVPPEKTADDAKGKAGKTETKVGKNQPNDTPTSEVDQSTLSILINGKK